MFKFAEVTIQDQKRKNSSLSPVLVPGIQNQRKIPLNLNVAMLKIPNKAYDVRVKIQNG